MIGFAGIRTFDEAWDVMLAKHPILPPLHMKDFRRPEGRLDGLEQRKYLFDLFQYGCIERLDGPYYANVLSLAQFGEGAKVEMRKVYLSPISGSTKEHTGWIVAKELLDIAPIQRVLDAMRAQHKATEVK